MIPQDSLKAQIGQVLLPTTQKPIAAYHAVSKLEVADDQCHMTLSFPFPIKQADKTSVEQEISKLSKSPVEVHWQLSIPSFQVATKVEKKAKIKNIIAVLSGKGGVGKSTVSTNLALALAKHARVGLLDGDIYGPSIPSLLGGAKQANIVGGKIQPMMRYGLQYISIGHLLQGDNAPVIWRGPMACGALTQLLDDTAWQSLDYLVIDLPPGTGDIQLTMAQKLPVTASVIVTQAHPLSILDAGKALAMMNKVNIPVLGIVENMASFECESCHHVHPLFGQAGGIQLADEFGVPLLASLPMMPEAQSHSEGMPLSLAKPQGKWAQAFENLATNTIAELALQPRDYSVNIPKIVMKN